MVNTSKNKILNVPNLRFPEYTDEWKESELQDISKISKGSGISKDQLSENGTPCILYGELYTKYKSEIISEVLSKTEINEKNLVHSRKNDIIIPSSGETAIDISTARYIPFDDIFIGGDLNIIRLHDQDGRFFSYQLNGVRKLDIAKIAQGVSVVHLYGENLKKLKVKFPSIKEQNKISSLLTIIDERIVTQSKIIEDLEKLKSAIRNRVFYRILLKYEPNMQIGDVLSYEQPTRYIVSDTEYSNESALIPVLTANKAFILGYTDDSDGVYRKGECIILDDFTLDCKIVDFPFKVKSSAIKILTTKANINIRYMYEYLKYLDLVTSEHKRHYITEVEPMEIAIPSQTEVDSIVRLFNAIDKRCSVAQDTFRRFQTQKRYLLNQMFI